MYLQYNAVDARMRALGAKKPTPRALNTENVTNLTRDWYRSGLEKYYARWMRHFSQKIIQQKN